MEMEPTWKFGVVGNIKESHIGEDGTVYYGTKAFSPGTKVYVDGKHRSGNIDEISVIGKNRFGKIVLERVPIDLIENVRAQRIYKPHVLKIIDYLEAMEGWSRWARTFADRKDTERFVREVKCREKKC